MTGLDRRIVILTRVSRRCACPRKYRHTISKCKLSYASEERIGQRLCRSEPRSSLGLILDQTHRDSDTR